MQEYYYELRVKPNIHYDLFLDLILNLSNEAVEEFNGTIICRSQNKLKHIEFGIKEFTKKLNITLKEKIKCNLKKLKLKNKNWISKYQKSVKPISVGMFYIHSSWEENKKKKINIVIDPKLSFGSGHHGTTNGCLRAISKYCKKNDTFLDIGSGSGILGIAASNLGCVVDICDTDVKAVNDTIFNFNNNGCKLNNSWTGSINKTKKKYDVIVANIVADVILSLNHQIKNNLTKNGILILSGILVKYQEKVLNKFKDYDILDLTQKGYWATITLKNRKKVNE